MEQTSTAHKILHFPLTKIIIGLVVCIGSITLSKYILGLLPFISSLDKTNKMMLMNTVVGVVALLSYSLLYRFYEKRNITELSAKGMGKSVLAGLALGVLLQSLTILVIYLCEGMTVLSVNDLKPLLPSLLLFFAVAVSEEILFRGILFRIIEEKLGSYAALGISALFFGFVHLLNPNSTLIVTIGLAVQAGLLLGAAYMYTKNLWFPIAIHYAWNFTQSTLFGAVTSGSTIGESWLTTQMHGTTWLTGGEFGPEGSIQATLFCLTATVILMVFNHRNNKIILPFWKQKKEVL